MSVPLGIRAREYNSQVQVHCCDPMKACRCFKEHKASLNKQTAAFLMLCRSAVADGFPNIAETAGLLSW